MKTIGILTYWSTKGWVYVALTYSDHFLAIHLITFDMSVALFSLFFSILIFINNCGSCRTNYSPSVGTSSCIKTDSTHSLWALRSLLASAVDLWFNLTVAVGTLNPIIFCANLICILNNLLPCPQAMATPSFSLLHFETLGVAWGWGYCQFACLFLGWILIIII